MIDPGRQAEQRDAALHTTIEQELKKIDVRIEPPRAFEIPTVDVNQFGSAAERVQLYLDAMTEWLALPCVYDAFEEDHTSRKAWRDYMRKTYGEPGAQAVEETKRSKIRYNEAGIPDLQREVLTMALNTEEHGNLAEQINAVGLPDALENTAEFRALALEDRGDVIEDLEERILMIFDILSAYKKTNK